MAEWAMPWAFTDRMKIRDAASAFVASRAAERAYERKLRSVAERVRTTLATTKPEQAEKALREYAELIGPWAAQSAATMLATVDRKNRDSFLREAARAGIDMRILLASPGVGYAVQDRIAENVRLIKSIVTHSADDVAKLVQESMATGMRAEDLAKRIERVGEVSKSRARTIAATEVSKAGTALTRARAESVGSEGYIWRTARDGAVRDSHRMMEGKFVRWDSPPTLDGMTGHAGEFPNDRCYPEPVIPRGDGTPYKQPLPTQEEEKAAGEQRLMTAWEHHTPEGGEAWPEVVRHVPGEPLYNIGKAKFISQKLTKYSLDVTSPKGKAKAEAFRKFLGFGPDDAQTIERLAMEGIRHLPAERMDTDKWGERFSVYVPMKGNNGKVANVLTAWIYDRLENGKLSTVPRLSNCYLDKKSIAYIKNMEKYHA